LLRVILDEAERNPGFAGRLEDVLSRVPPSALPQAREPSGERLSGETKAPVVRPVLPRHPAAGPRLAAAPVREAPAAPVARSRATAVAALDPVQLARRGEAELRASLAGLTLKQLHAIVAAHAMDASGYVRRWKSSARVIERIVEIAAARAKKGQAFLA
jgi:hypothetical protein